MDENTMGERTRKLLNMLPVQDGAMTSTSKDAINILLGEVEKNGLKTEAVAGDLKNLRESFNTCAKLLANTSEQIKALNLAQAESMRRTNEIYEMLSVNHVEEKAAQMDFLQRIVGSKFGKAVIIFLAVAVVASGVAVVYFINNYKQVTEIVDSIKK